MCLWIQHVKVIILFDEFLLSVPAVLVGFLAGHFNITSTGRKQVTIFVRYNISILP
jgi:hypothetical protein